MIPLRFLVLPSLFLVGGVAACTRAEEVETTATRSAEFAVEGMTCTGCEGAIGTAVQALEGIESCQASFATGQVVVVYKPALTDEAKIADAIRAAGYTIPAKK